MIDSHTADTGAALHCDGDVRLQLYFLKYRCNRPDYTHGRIKPGLKAA